MNSTKKSKLDFGSKLFGLPAEGQALPGQVDEGHALLGHIDEGHALPLHQRANAWRPEVEDVDGGGTEQRCGASAAGTSDPGAPAVLPAELCCGCHESSRAERRLMFASGGHALGGRVEGAVGRSGRGGASCARRLRARRD